MITSESENTSHLEALGEVFKKVADQLKTLLYPNDPLIGKMHIKRSTRTFQITNDVEQDEEEKEKNEEIEIKYDCFIAHEWGGWKENHPTHQKAKKLKEVLTATGLEVWLDEDNLGNNVQTGIAKGLKESAVVIILLTENYFERCENKDTNAHK